MCASCGCGDGSFNHGDPDNITFDKVRDDLTEDELQRAADAQGISVEEVRRNIAATAN